MADGTPSKLYKYQPFNLYSLLNLTRRELYFSKPENLNDPYDCDPPFEITKTDRTQNNKKALFDKVKNYEVRKSGIDGSMFDQLYSTNGKPDDRFRRKYIDNPKPIQAQISEKIGVTCFSERADNLLLWSHYADKHQGFCLEFEVHTLLNDYPETKLYKVKYPKSNKLIRFSILEILNNPDLLEKILTRKSYSWHYEQEWRLFCRTGGNETFRYNPKTVTNIYFGKNMAYKHKEIIISILSTPLEHTTDEAIINTSYPNTQISGTKINVYDMELNRNIFKVRPIRFRPRTQ